MTSELLIEEKLWLDSIHRYVLGCEFDTLSHLTTACLFKWFLKRDCLIIIHCKKLLLVTKIWVLNSNWCSKWTTKRTLLQLANVWTGGGRKKEKKKETISLPFLPSRKLITELRTRRQRKFFTLWTNHMAVHQTYKETISLIPLRVESQFSSFLKNQDWEMHL